MCSIAKDIGIDLGTASVLVYVKGKGVVLNEPSVVAIDKNTGKLLKVGAEAQAMLGRTPGNIVAIRPLREGVISDYDMTERMLREFLRKVVDGFDKLIEARTGIHTVVAEGAISCVAEGTGKSLDSLNAMTDGTVNLSRRKQKTKAKPGGPHRGGLFLKLLLQLPRKSATITIHENEIRRNHHEVFQQGLEMRPVPHAEVPPLRGGGGGQGQEDLSSEHRSAGYRDAQGVLRCGEAL